MSRIVKCAHIQAANAKHDGAPAEIKEAMIQKHIPLIEEAGQKSVQILCLQEIFHGPYFCAEQDIKWYETAEKVPGPIIERFSEYAKKYRMVMVIPDEGTCEFIPVLGYTCYENCVFEVTTEQSTYEVGVVEYQSPE